MNKIFIICILIFLVIPFSVRSLQTNSSNYGISSFVFSSGGTNTTSANYAANIVMGTISGEIVSSTYKQFLGIFYLTIKETLVKRTFVSLYFLDSGETSLAEQTMPNMISGMQRFLYFLNNIIQRILNVVF